MIEFEKPNIECLVDDRINNYGKFVCEPLERGYGITLGNALRRVLLSSLPGAAITGVKIEGVQHEFTTIPNIVEDVMEIILNLKSVRFKMDTQEPKKLTLKHKGAGVITAGDIKTVDGIGVLNKDLVIATASEGANLVMELTVEKGRGYNTVERNKKENEDINYIAIDSIFTPVKKVNYVIENTRVGDRTDYDRLVLEVWTDGSLTTEESISLAAKIMSSHLELFIDLTDVVRKVQVMLEPKKEEDLEVLDRKVEDLEFSKRPMNCLKIKEIKTVRDLISYTKEEVKKFKNLGAKSLEEIVNKVEELGLEFKKEDK